MTNDQITKINYQLGRKLYEDGPPSDVVDRIFELYRNELIVDLVATVKKWAQVVTGFSFRCIKIDRSRAPQEAIDALIGVEQEIDQSVMATMPGYEPEKSSDQSVMKMMLYKLIFVAKRWWAKVTRSLAPQEAVVAKEKGRSDPLAVTTIVPIISDEEDGFFFFRMSCDSTHDEINEKCDSLRRDLVDPYELCAINAANPELATSFPNATIWKDAKGKWCQIACYTDLGGRFVRVGHPKTNHWRRDWWFGSKKRKNIDGLADTRSFISSTNGNMN